MNKIEKAIFAATFAAAFHADYLLGRSRTIGDEYFVAAEEAIDSYRVEVARRKEKLSSLFFNPGSE